MFESAETRIAWKKIAENVHHKMGACIDYVIFSFKNGHTSFNQTDKEIA
jgi:hypothetical protein